jgi:predicted nucleic acid-binding protein
MICIISDASAVISILINDQTSNDCQRALLTDFHQMYAPELLQVEVVHTLRRLERVGDCSALDAERMLGLFYELPIQFTAHRFLMSRVWELRHNFTAYDATYISLAEYLDAKFITLDQRLARSAKSYVDVQVPGLKDL